MIDESKHLYWKPAMGIALKDLQCPRCGHYISINDFYRTSDICPFCGKRLPIKHNYFDVVETKEDSLKMRDTNEQDEV